MFFKDDLELYRTIGQNIKFYREKAHLTQQELAEATKLSLSYISKIEASGCNKSMSISALNQIANALKIEINNFFGEVSFYESNN